MTQKLAMILALALTAPLSQQTIADDAMQNKPSNIEQRRQLLLEKYDADGDGKITKEESAPILKHHESRRVEIRSLDSSRLPKGILNKFDSDGDGTLSDDEKNQITQHLTNSGKARLSAKDSFKNFDTDGDGTLSKQEREEARLSINTKRAEMLKSKKPQ